MNVFMWIFGRRCEECHELTIWESKGDRLLCAKCDGKRVGKELAEEFGRELRKKQIMEK